METKEADPDPNISTKEAKTETKDLGELLERINSIMEGIGPTEPTVKEVITLRLGVREVSTGTPIRIKEVPVTVKENLEPKMIVFGVEIAGVETMIGLMVLSGNEIIQKIFIYLFGDSK